MAFNKVIRNRYSSYITRKILYIKMLNKIKIVELFKKPLSIAYKGKKILLTKTRESSIK